MSEWLYGHHPILETLLAERRQIHQVLLADGARTSGDVKRILDLAAHRHVPVNRVKRQRLDSMLRDDVNHQGMAAQVSDYPYVDWKTVVEEAMAGDDPPFLLLLDRLQDPQNLGALLRTAEAVGVDGIAIPKRRAASVTPAVSRASAGAVEHLSIAQVPNIAQTIVELKEAGVWVFGVERAPGSVPYSQVDFHGPLALVIGSEGDGLGRLVGERCDLLFDLPMRGRVTSLNASVAGSVALYFALHGRVK